MNNQENKLVLFQSKKIRRIWHNEEWFYSVVDVVEALTDSPTPRQYWGKIKKGIYRSSVVPNLGTTEISNQEKPKAMIEHTNVARRGGVVAGNARKQAESELGRSVISKENYLQDGMRKRLKKSNGGPSWT